MHIREVDERDSSWEDHNPVFRVYTFRGGERHDASWTTWTYDVDDTDLIDVAQWAQGEVGGSGLYAGALVSHASAAPDEPLRKGLVWLIGNDANGEPLSPREGAAQKRMNDLRGKSITFGRWLHRRSPTAVAAGMGMSNGPASSASTACVPEDQVGSASGVSNMARYVGAAVASALAASVYGSVIADRTADLRPLPRPERSPCARRPAAAS